MTTKLNFGVLIIDLSFHKNVWRLSPFHIIYSKYLAYFSYEKVMESRHNMLFYVFINSDHKRIQECSISVKGRVICNQGCLKSDQPGV